MFVKGEKIQVFSQSQRAWLDATIDEISQADSYIDGYAVKAGTLKVVYANGSYKFVPPEQIKTTVQKTAPVRELEHIFVESVGDWKVCEDATGHYYYHRASKKRVETVPPEFLTLFPAGYTPPPLGALARAREAEARKQRSKATVAKQAVSFAGSYDDCCGGVSTIAQAGNTVIASNPNHTWSPASGTVNGNIISMLGLTGTLSSKTISWSNGLTWILQPDLIGFWEYQGDSGSWMPYTRDECRQLENAHKRSTEFLMDIGPNKYMFTFGPDKMGTQINVKTRTERRTRREASANELVEHARVTMRECMKKQVARELPHESKKDSIMEILQRETQPVKLLRGSWLLNYADNDGTNAGLPRRQDLETKCASQSFLPATEVECKKGFRTHYSNSLNIISISYCWRAPHHPDADGKQLRVIARNIKRPNDADQVCYSRAFQDIGFFWDFGSLHQKDQFGKRTKQEWQQFNEALRDMGIWFVHRMIMTFILSTSFEAGVDYNSRGWTYFERSCAELVKPAFAGNMPAHSWPMINDLGNAPRRLPQSPEQFAEQLAQRQFTSRGDKEVVVQLYTETCMRVLRGLVMLDLSGVDLQQGDGERFASVLSQCCSLEIALLADMGIDDCEMKALAGALPSCTNLGRLDLSINQIGDAGAKVIATAIVSCPSLWYLGLFHNEIGDAGAEALAASIPRSSLEQLVITLGGVGRKTLEKAWYAAGKPSPARSAGLAFC